ncbi:MAG TPA: YhgE/Pip domain-containing protein, partial [Lachnospiraceae bacterium]|nr:YhgE/Pip domain-containing protein [Lachnospiraceae bacterium]
LNGFYDGDYYAALIIPENFTQSIAGITSGDLSGGTITYYENEKKNAIATKITSKAQSAVETQINQTVFRTLTKIVSEIGDALKNVEEQGSLYVTALSALEETEKDIKHYMASLDAIKYTMDSARSSIRTLNKLSQKMVTDLQKDLTLLSDSPLQISGIQTVNIRLNDYSDVLKKGSNSIKQSKTLLKELKNTIGDMKKEIAGAGDSETLQNIFSVLENQPEKIGDYFASLVNLKTERVYKTENYGSGMASFYTVLAIWVGALILVSIIHTQVKTPPSEKPYKVYEEFFGRYAIFFLIGQIQTLICVAGNLFFLEIQCLHPFLFWLASAASSFIFTLLIYTLVFVLGNVGEALAVVIMVIQVAGTGGTFPKEVLPMIYQKVYQFLPFPYCMTALRECVSGMYGKDYLISLLQLAPFAVFSILLGLLLKKPFDGLNKRVEKSKEKSGLMV